MSWCARLPGHRGPANAYLRWSPADFSPHCTGSLRTSPRGATCGRTVYQPLLAQGPLACPGGLPLLQTHGAQESALQTAGALLTLSHLKVNLQILCPVLKPGLGCFCVHCCHVTTASSWALVAQIHCVQELSPGAQQLLGYWPMSSEGKQGDLGLDLVLPRGWSSFSWASPTVARPKASAEAPGCGGWQEVRAHGAQAAIGGAGTSSVLPYSRNGVPQIRVSFFLHLDFSLEYCSGVGFSSVTLFLKSKTMSPFPLGTESEFTQLGSYSEAFFPSFSSLGM